MLPAPQYTTTTDVDVDVQVFASAIDEESDRIVDPDGAAVTRTGRRDLGLDKLIEKVPQSIWQANSVVQEDRWKAHLYWGLLLIGYVVYIALAVRDGFERRENPAVQLKRIDEAFQLPDVGFCFEGDTYGSRFACFDEADGEDCAGSLQGDAFVYGYNYTGYTTPDDYPVSDDYIVLFPDFLSSTCRRFRLSNLTATDSSAAWRFHMLMFWTSEYNATLNPGAFESVKMYLYDGGLTAEQISDTPITLYAPMSFDASEVPFVRGFLEYEMRVMLDQSVENTYTVVDTTASDWHNAEDAVYLAKKFDTDSVASIQLDVRRLTYLRYEEIDPMDVIGTIGEISGFWLVVPLLFGLLFHRPAAENEEQRSFRGLGCCKSRSQVQQPRTDFSVRRWTSEVTRNG